MKKRPKTKIFSENTKNINNYKLKRFLNETQESLLIIKVKPLILMIILKNESNSHLKIVT